jgi:hypothetical protein
MVQYAILRLIPESIGHFDKCGPVLQSFAGELTLIKSIIAIQKASCFMLDVILLFHVFVHFLCWPKGEILNFEF